ncbi:unnamed protein product, partial [Amoebophrya sp. A25]
QGSDEKGWESRGARNPNGRCEQRTRRRKHHHEGGCRVERFGKSGLRVIPLSGRL